MEGFLARLAGSWYATQLVLKGGVLLTVYDSRRPTRDVDLQGWGLPNDADSILRVVRSIAQILRDDGLIFDADADAATAQVIRDGDEDLYSGVRVHVLARLAGAKLAFHIDVSVGDPITPAPQLINLPRLLDGSITLMGYPLSMVYAEKIVTAVERGQLNTRMRDFADIYALVRGHDIVGVELLAAVARVAEHRRINLRPLSVVLDGWADAAQPQWTRWLCRQNLDKATPGRFPADLSSILNQVMEFADPILTGAITDQTWNAVDRRWA
ncbi:MAG: nucleotidyl transferase AbiEii/AbiGii toxin family protein [Mycobacteriales bacterium]